MNISLKNITFISCIIFILGVLSTSTACNASLEDDPPAHFVSFTLNGTPYVLTGGYTGQNIFDAGANGNHLTIIDFVTSDERDWIRIAAIDASLSDMGSQGPYIYLTIVAKSINTPIIPGDYDGEGGAGFNISVDGDIEFTHSDFYNFSLNLISPGDSVGGAIQGTFSGSSEDGSLTLEDGVFFVERLADRSILPPSQWQ